MVHGYAAATQSPRDLSGRSAIPTYLFLLLGTKAEYAPCSFAQVLSGSVQVPNPSIHKTASYGEDNAVLIVIHLPFYLNLASTPMLSTPLSYILITLLATFAGQPVTNGAQFTDYRNMQGTEPICIPLPQLMSTVLPPVHYWFTASLRRWTRASDLMSLTMPALSTCS